MTFNIPKKENHKGQNGKVLIVGGSELFHAASLWSAQMAAHLVDMVFYASVSQNNDIVKESKKKFFDGIVVGRDELENYAREADVILLGPGLARGERRRERLAEILREENGQLTAKEWERDSYLITNYILAKFPQKKFVLDAGALQMLDLHYLPNNCILTPHQLELQQLIELAKLSGEEEKLRQAVVVSKGQTDIITEEKRIVAQVKGGNAGLTKGGSGDVLAGLIAGLWAYNEASVAAEYGSRALKTAGNELFAKVGPFFTTTQLLEAIPETLWAIWQTEQAEEAKKWQEKRGKKTGCLNTVGH